MKIRLLSLEPQYGTEPLLIRSISIIRHSEASSCCSPLYNLSYCTTRNLSASTSEELDNVSNILNWNKNVTKHVRIIISPGLKDKCNRQNTVHLTKYVHGSHCFVKCCCGWLFFSGQNGDRLSHDIVKCILVNGKFYISIQISVKFVHEGPIDNKPTLVHVMACRRIGDKP